MTLRKMEYSVNQPLLFLHEHFIKKMHSFFFLSLFISSFRKKGPPFLYASHKQSLIQGISKYQMRPLYNLREALGKIKERTTPSSVRNSSNNSEPNLFKKVRTLLLCFRAKVLTQESRSNYFTRYKLFFFEDPL